MESVGHTSH